LISFIININSINDEVYTARIKKETEEMVEKGSKIADQVYEKVLEIMA